MYRRLFLGSFNRSLSVVILAFCWVLGLCCGASYSLATMDSYSVLMRTLPDSRVSIVGLVVNLFSLLIVYIAACRLIPNAFIYVIALVKAFVFSYGLTGAYALYGTAGWLIHLLISFTDAFTIVPFLWFLIRSIYGHRRTLNRDAVFCLCVYSIIFLIDFFCISPFFLHIRSLI